MARRKGFTLVELMVVVMIVGILAAVAIPIMRGRIDAAKWTEGKAMAGTIASSIRAYAAEKGNGPDANWGDEGTLTWDELGLIQTDFQGTYFSPADFTWNGTCTADNILTFSVTVTAPAEITTEPTQWTLDQTGTWTPGSAGGP